ncbi:RloB family protein [Streptomyces sp. NPDC058964]|uniref:RloB family protein n=1 Tax=Streptomyces sp. NPDC058964 TaxID=3346681 RepID=UPI0036901980
MARDKGRDSAGRARRTRPGDRPREVYVFTEGEVTEPEFVEFVMEHGTRAQQGRKINYSIENAAASSSRRKPLPLVQDAVTKLEGARKAARKAGLTPEDWNWPQVWCLFDRDQHRDIPTAFARAEREGVRIAYSHPCFELWRLLHYQNYTSTFGGVCNDAASRLKKQEGFTETYGVSARSVSAEDAKRVKAGQLQRKYKKARQYAEKINARREGRDQTRWDPYTDVWRFVEDGLDVIDY